MKYNHYNNNLKGYARKLRARSVSKAEKRLWKLVLSRKQMGVGFKRQRPIDSFIVDFFSQEINLIIEIDGSSHSNQSKHDRYKQDRLESFGYHFLRLSESEVLNQLNKAIQDIEHAVYVLKMKYPPPQSPSKGGGLEAHPSPLIPPPKREEELEEPLPKYVIGGGLIAVKTKSSSSFPLQREE